MSEQSIREATTSTESLSRNEKEIDERDQNNLENITTLQVTGPPPAFDPLKKIKEGFNHFKINDFNKNTAYYRKLAEKDEPKFLIFACSDSRVCPANVLNLRPGEAFVNRNIANMVPVSNKAKYCEIGAIIKYAIAVKKVEAILVMGHSRCGGINRLVSLPDKQTSSDFVDEWVSLGKAAKKKVLAKNPKASGEQLRTLVEKESVMGSLANLLSYPLVKTGVANKKIKLIGGYYDFVKGNFDILGTRS
ncbi:hypothetical protein LXL04_009550 [Taraxacum kok-saghyz]